MPRVTPVPEVYILWHPDCSLAEQLASKIYDWLRPGNGLGPQVFYRSHKAPEAPEGGLPVPIPGESRISHGMRSELERGANVQLIILLINADMIADPVWRVWLADLSRTDSSHFPRKFFPVALDPTAYNIPDPLRRQNFLRPAGLQNGSGLGRSDSLEVVTRSLLKQLTETLCRYMISGSAESSGIDLAEEADDKPKIFLSHAKADGTNPAQRIRDYIYSQTQLTAFYDENDIAYGAPFSDVLESGLKAAALIAVRSAKYSSRPWCRRELATFRKPRPESEAGAVVERWRLFPTLVVDSMEGRQQTPGIPEFGNSTCLRWDESLAEQEEQIVTTVMRDVMLSAFHSAVGANLSDGAPGDHIFLNWLPDPTSLLHIDGVRENRGEVHVVYPGRGMSGLELDILFEFFPHLTFHSFEEYHLRHQL